MPRFLLRVIPGIIGFVAVLVAIEVSHSLANAKQYFDQDGIHNSASPCSQALNSNVHSMCYWLNKQCFNQACGSVDNSASLLDRIANGYIPNACTHRGYVDNSVPSVDSCTSVDRRSGDGSGRVPGCILVCFSPIPPACGLHTISQLICLMADIPPGSFTMFTQCSFCRNGGKNSTSCCPDGKGIHLNFDGRQILGIEPVYHFSLVAGISIAVFVLLVFRLESRIKKAHLHATTQAKWTNSRTTTNRGIGLVRSKFELDVQFQDRIGR